MLGTDQHRVLYIDLSAKRSELKIHSNYSQSVGGLGLACSVYYDNVESDPIVFAIGPLTGLFPFASNTCAVFRSPLTRHLAESFSGGWFGSLMRMANIDALVLSGKSLVPLVLELNGEEVNFHPAENFWGMTTSQTRKAMNERFGQLGRRSTVVIGPAGERGFAFSSAVVDGAYAFSRFGLGARLGEMGLKGLVLSAENSLSLGNLVRYREVYDGIRRSFDSEDPDVLFPNFRRTASLAGLDEEKASGGIPRSNWHGIGIEGSLTEEMIIRSTQARPLASFGCTSPDIFLAPFQKSLLPLRYDGLLGLGVLLGIEDLPQILNLNLLAWEYGFDPISLGGSLAYLTESTGIALGRGDTFETLINSFINQKEDWSLSLSQGLGFLSPTEGSCAVTIRALEPFPVFNGYATLLSALVSTSGDIAELEGDRIDLGMLGQEFEDEDLIDHLHLRHQMITLLSCLGVDYPARGLYADKFLIFLCLSSLGYSWSREDLDLLGYKIISLKREIDRRFPQPSSEIPPRLFHIPSAYGVLKPERLKSMLNLFQEKYLKENKGV